MRQLSNEPAAELKVVFLGDGEAGKSHILDRLLRDGEQAVDFTGDSTPGILIRDKTYEIDGRPVRVHFWDFGGQDILHSLYRMFLTERTLYVVVLNSRDDTQDDRARYWLHSIRSFAGESPVLMVLNKVDQNPRASVNEPYLRELCPSLTKIVKMSALQFSREEFTRTCIDALLEDIRQFDTTNIIWPSSWLQLKRSLETTEEHCITGRDYVQLCRKCGVDQNGKELLRRFSDLGICVHYQGNARLDDYIVLRPEWITNAILSLFFNLRGDVRNGIVPHNTIYDLLATDRADVRRAIPDVTYSVGEVTYILEVMRKFRLSFRMDEDAEFIPTLCHADASPIVYEYASDPATLEFRMEYEYLPTHVIHRLMVDLRQDLDRNHVWRTGARFYSGTMGLSAVVSVRGDQLRILVRSQSRHYSARTYLALIRSTLEHINRQMGLGQTRDLVVYKADGIVEPFDYDMLLATQANGVSSVYSRSFRKMISVQDILSQTDSTARAEKNKLLQDLITACSSMQAQHVYWTASENSRLSFLGNMLNAQGHIVIDQHRSGRSASGLSAGELELDIRKEPDIPWAFCEDLTIRGSSSAELRNWEDHLRKLLNRYHANAVLGYLVCYVDCSAEKFAKVCEEYLSHLRSRDVRNAPAHCTPVETKLHGIAAAQCIYDLDGFPFEVCHIFVRMGQ